MTERVPVDDVVVLLALSGQPQPNANCRERKIVVAIASRRGWESKEIARVIGLTTRTVERHRKDLVDA